MGFGGKKKKKKKKSRKRKRKVRGEVEIATTALRVMASRFVMAEHSMSTNLSSVSNKALRYIFAEERQDLSKRATNALRKANEFIPASLQGRGLPNRFLVIPLSDIARDFHEGRFVQRNVSNATFGGPVYMLSIRSLGHDRGHRTETERVLAKQLRVNPMNHAPVSVNFVRAPEDEPLMMELPLAPVNADKCDVLKNGFLLHLVKSVMVRVDPFATPPECAWLDLAGRTIGTIEAGDLILPDGVDLMSDPHQRVVKIAVKA